MSIGKPPGSVNEGAERLVARVASVALNQAAVGAVLLA
jgi:hypothetical protein